MKQDPQHEKRGIAYTHSIILTYPSFYKMNREKAFKIGPLYLLQGPTVTDRVTQIKDFVSYSNICPFLSIPITTSSLVSLPLDQTPPTLVNTVNLNIMK